MRRRIVVLAVLAAVLATSLFGVPLAIGVTQFYTDVEHSEVERAADVAAIAVAADLARGITPATLPAHSSDLEVGFYDATGSRGTGQGPAGGDPLVRAALAGTVVSGSDLVGQ